MTKLFTTVVRKLKFLVVKIVIYFLSFELGGKILGVTKQLGEYISSKEIVFPLNIKDIKPKKTWLEIIDEATRNGKKIKPVNYKKHSPSENIFCPDCGAPSKYIHYNAVVKGLQKFRCKLCHRQWIQERIRKNIALYCPYCKTVLQLEKVRTDFKLFKCHNKHCVHRLKNHHRYSFRIYNLNLDKLVASVPSAGPVDFSMLKFHEDILPFILTLRVSYGLSTRNTSKAMFDFFSLKISHNTISDYLETLAYLFTFFTDKIPIDPSPTWIIDDTVRKYQGKKGYLFAIIDDNGKLLAQHFSKKRNVLAVVSIFLDALKKTNGKFPSLIISDAFPTFSLAFWLLAQLFPDVSFVHKKVKGLKDPPKQHNPYRYLKNLIERFFGTSRFYSHLFRGFKSFNAVVVQSFLFGVFYNFLRCHSRFDLPPVYLSQIYDGNNVHGWANIINSAWTHLEPSAV